MFFFALVTGLDDLRGWYKGANTTSLLIYLESRIREDIQHNLEDVSADVLNYFEKIQAMIAACNQYMRVLYHAALILTDEERNELIRTGRIVEKLYRKCANFSYHQNLTRFKIQPKFHMLGELIYELEVDKKCRRPSPSPLSYSTQMDEDFVGHISMASRKVSIRTLHERTIGKYRISLAMHWNKPQVNEKS